MLLPQIIFFILLLILYRLIFRLRGLNRALFFISILAIFWFQPVSTIRTLDFWFPSLIILISVTVWGYIYGFDQFNDKRNKKTLGYIFLFFIFLGFVRNLGISFIYHFIAIPELHIILGFLLLFVVIFLFSMHLRGGRISGILIVSLIIIMLTIQKYPIAAERMSIFLRQINRQSTALAGRVEIAWIGFSYFAFRILHVLFEKNRFSRELVSLNDFLVYLVYFPAFTAGPIARLDQFMGELTKERENNFHEDVLKGGKRICRGLISKFILADYLAIITIGENSVMDIQSNGWVWLMVYAYSARIFFDFAGYTDIAIGISQLIGIRLPENFYKPYLSPNISVFWNRWHITLTQWFRTYYFNPVVRYFRTRRINVPQYIFVLFSQFSTMLLISLWHGISLNFVIWGLWHGTGLFLHNRWVEVIKPKVDLHFRLSSSWAAHVFSIFATFNFITLGWIWFAIPKFSDALLIFERLFGWL